MDAYSNSVPHEVDAIHQLEVDLKQVAANPQRFPRTTKLIAAGAPQQAKKMVEEAAELAIEAVRCDRSAAIIEAARSYVAAHSAISKMTVTVEQVVDDFARAKVTPEKSNAADSAFVFLQKKDGKGIGVILGSGFTTEDYQQLGIPNALRVP